MAANSRLRQKIHLLNYAGNAPKLAQSMDSESSNGYMLTWSTNDLAFTASDPRTAGVKLAPNITLSESKVVLAKDSVVVASFFPFNPADYTSNATVKLQVGVVVPAGGTARARLYNFDDREYITSSETTSTSTTPVILTTTITTGGSSGEMPESTKNYELRLDVASENNEHYAVFGSVGMRVMT